MNKRLICQNGIVSTASKESQEIQMFGQTVAEMRDAAVFTNLKDPVDLIQYAISILSDAQYMTQVGETEIARQYTNKAKYFMAEAKSLLRDKE